MIAAFFILLLGIVKRVCWRMTRGEGRTRSRVSPDIECKLADGNSTRYSKIKESNSPDQRCKKAPTKGKATDCENEEAVPSGTVAASPSGSRTMPAPKKSILVHRDKSHESAQGCSESSARTRKKVRFSLPGKSERCSLRSRLARQSKKSRVSVLCCAQTEQKQPGKECNQPYGRRAAPVSALDTQATPRNAALLQGTCQNNPIPMFPITLLIPATPPSSSYPPEHDIPTGKPSETPTPSTTATSSLQGAPAAPTQHVITTQQSHSAQSLTGNPPRSSSPPSTPLISPDTATINPVVNTEHSEAVATDSETAIGEMKMTRRKRSWFNKLKEKLFGCKRKDKVL